MKIIVTFEVDADKISLDGKDANYEGYRNLVENVLRDGLDEIEPEAKIENVMVLSKE